MADMSGFNVPTGYGAAGGTGSNVNWGQVAGGVIGGLGGLFNLFSGSPYSTTGAQQNAASAANPWGQYASQFAQMIPQAVTNLGNAPMNQSFQQAIQSAAPYAMLPGASQGLINSAGTASLPAGLLASMGGMPSLSGAAGVAGQGVSSAGLTGATGGQGLMPSLASLSQSDPSVQFRYNQGLDALSRGASATGMLGSGATAKAFEDYGQNFASTEYQNQFARDTQLQSLMNSMQATNYGQQSNTFSQLLGQQGQNFGQQLGLYSSGLAGQAQGFGQQSTLAQLMSGIQNQNFNQELGLQNLNVNTQTQQFQNLLAGGQFQNQALTSNASQQALMLQLLSQLGQVNTSSPGEQGKILSGAYQGSVNQAQSDVGSGLGTVLGAAGTAIGGPIGGAIGSFIGGLF